jgi:hypothetical protein
MNKTIKISAKCSDLMFATLHDENGKQIGSKHDGYVPDWLGVDGYGDYVNLTIDITTGEILNWKRPTNFDLNETFGACANVPLKKIVKNTLYGKLGNPKGSIKVKGQHFNSIQDAVNFKQNSANDSHLKMRRDKQGHFIKMDDIARFQYPHTDYYGNVYYLWRNVKIVKQNPIAIEGIENNANGQSGYKKFLKSKMVGKVMIDKGYLD